MASQLHTYTAHVTWSGGREGAGSIRNDNSGQGYDILVPQEFGGPGGALNPEELLTNAISGCYSITYGIVATNRRIPLKSVEVKGVGTVEQSGVNFVYKTISLSPTITLGADATDQDIATAIDMAHKADAYCIVTNAVRDKVEVSITPNVRREGQDAQPTKPVSGDQTLDTTSVAQGATTATATSVGATSEALGTVTTPPNPDQTTAPSDDASYEGDPQSENAYPEAGDAEKPSSATGTESGEATGVEVAENSSQTGAESNGESNGSDLNGTNPENSEVDDSSASSKQTGNPESMQVGAVPG